MLECTGEELNYKIQCLYSYNCSSKTRAILNYFKLKVKSLDNFVDAIA
jgi:hypothetical protein